MDANAAPSLGTDSLLSRPIGPLVSPPMPWNTFPCLTSECRRLAFPPVFNALDGLFPLGKHTLAAGLLRPSFRDQKAVTHIVCSEILPALACLKPSWEAGGWQLPGFAGLQGQAWLLPNGCCVSKVRIWFLQSQNIPFTKTLGDTWWFPFCISPNLSQMVALQTFLNTGESPQLVLAVSRSCRLTSPKVECCLLWSDLITPKSGFAPLWTLRGAPEYR